MTPANRLYFTASELRDFICARDHHSRYPEPPAMCPIPGCGATTFTPATADEVRRHATTRGIR
jgi:hypothetical protein